MQCDRNKEKQRKFGNISAEYGDGDLQLSDSDEDDETVVKQESNRDISYISKHVSAITESG